MTRFLIIMIAIACAHQASAKPVRRTLNFNMFVLNPQDKDSASPDRTILATDGVSRFGPILEYLVQRVQGMMSTHVPPETNNEKMKLTLDTSENEVDGLQSRMPGVLVRPSRTKPGTYEVEIDVVVDDGQPAKIN